MKSDYDASLYSPPVNQLTVKSVYDASLNSPSVNQLTVGVFGHEEEVLDKPVSPNEIRNILYAKCMPHDICQAVLQQELILAIGKHIATLPEQYDGILKIRIGSVQDCLSDEVKGECAVNFLCLVF